MGAAAMENTEKMAAGWTRAGVIQVPHRTKSWPNSGSETGATKKGTLFVLVLLCSMGWGSIHVFQPENVGST